MTPTATESSGPSRLLSARQPPDDLGDSRASGRLALSADRVTDLLNQHDEFTFVDLSVQSLDDGRELALPEAVVMREEMCAVAVSGPQGNPRRRMRTRPCPVELRLGHYDVSGNLHVLPGTDPLAGFFDRRQVMVPLTEAGHGHPRPVPRRGRSRAGRAPLAKCPAQKHDGEQNQKGAGCQHDRRTARRGTHRPAEKPADGRSHRPERPADGRSDAADR